MADTVKLKIPIVGENGNSFIILATARATMKNAGWSKDQMNKVLEEAMDGDYDHLLRTMMKYFDVV